MGSIKIEFGSDRRILKIISIFIIFLIITSNLILLTSTAEDSNFDLSQPTRSNFNAYIDVTADPTPILIQRVGDHTVNFTFEEYNGITATLQTVNYEYTNVRGYNIYPQDVSYLDNLKVEGASNTTWTFELPVSPDLVQASMQAGLNKLFLKTAFYGTDEFGADVLIEKDFPVEFKFKVAVIVDSMIHSDLKPKLQRYYNDVNSKLKVEFIECHDNWGSIQSIRNHLKELWQTQNISGAILIGYLPIPMWEIIHDDSSRETCPIPIFYEDLDGDFADTDSNGYYDRHYWGENDGPEIWVSFIMPNIIGNTIPSTHLDPSGALTSGGLQADYYENNDLTQYSGSRVDPVIDFDWVEDPLLNDIAPKNFSIRWAGKIKTDYTEAYSFYTEAMGGVKVWLDDTIAIDRGFDYPNYMQQSTHIRHLASGWHDIKVEYYENGKGISNIGMLRLSWSSPSLKIDKFCEFFDKTHLYYTGELNQPETGLEFMDYCYGLQCQMKEPIKARMLDALYGENLIIGGCEETTNASEYLELLKPGYELVSVWSHAASSAHSIAPKDCSGGDPIGANYYQIRRRDAGMLTLIWGCHAGDIMVHGALERDLSKNLVANYAFNTKYGLAATGCTRSFGTTFEQTYYSLQNKSYLGLGYFAFKDEAYDYESRMAVYPSVAEDRWIDDEILMGDPFITICHRPTDLKIVIEDGKKFITDTDVTLKLSSVNTGEMSLRNEGGQWTSWEPFAPTKSWQLPEGTGYKKVEFRMRNSYGSSYNIASDVIGLVDSNPPVIEYIKINDDNETTNNITVKINLLVTDELPGALQISLSNDGVNWGSWQPYTLQTNLDLDSGDGWKSVYLKCIDAGGTKSEIVKDSIFLDTTPPKTYHKIIGSVGENGWYTDELKIELSNTVESHDVDSCWYKVDNGIWLDYEQPFLVFKDGHHNIEYYSIDRSGNMEKINNFSVKLDTHPPWNISVIINEGLELTNTSCIHLNISSEDEMSGCWMMRLGEDPSSWGPWVEYNESVGFTLDSKGEDGTRTVYLEVKDQAGNIVDEPVIDDIILDTTAPQILSIEPEDRAVDVNIDTNITIKFTEKLPYKSLTSSSIYLKDHEQNIVESKIRYDQDDNTVTINPISDLEYYNNYTLIIDPSIEDLAGNHFTNPVDYYFITTGLRPSAVRDIKLSLSNDNVSINWQPPLDEGSTPILGYNIYRKSGAGDGELVCSVPSNATTYLDKNVTSNRLYSYSVSAYNEIGEGPLYEFLIISIPKEKDDKIIEDEEERNDENTEKKKEEPEIYIGVIITIIIISVLLSIIILIKKKDWIHTKLKRIKPVDELPQDVLRNLQPPLQPRSK